jgi:hypothetical protein
MCAPADVVERRALTAKLRSWVEGGPPPRQFQSAQKRWVHVADLVRIHRALKATEFPSERGGASIGKSVYLLDRRGRAIGTGRANVWKSWKTYKDVAHLAAATGLLCVDLQRRHRRKPFRLELGDLSPVRVLLRMPEAVLSAALSFQVYGLSSLEEKTGRPLFDPKTLWRVPDDLNIEPVELPEPFLTPEETQAILTRRAGNRGKR